MKIKYNKIIYNLYNFHSWYKEENKANKFRKHPRKFYKLETSSQNFLKFNPF